jgi:hypothetical protein
VAYDAQSPGADSGSDEVTAEALKRRWPEFLNALRPRNLPLEALMRSCEPVAVEDETIVLGFAHDFHRLKLEEDQNKRDVEDTLSDLIGRRCRVRCVLNRPDQPPAATLPTAVGSESAPSTQAAAAAPSIAKKDDGPAPMSAEELLAQDPVVRTAVEDLGAQIVSHSE